MARSAARQAWDDAHREELRAYHRVWSRANKDRVRGYAAKADPEQRKAKARERVRRYRERHRNDQAVSAVRREQTPGQRECSRARTAAWKRTHPERVKELNAQSRQRHLDANRERARRYAADHAAQRAITSKEWRAANLDRHAIKEQRRRARIRNAPGEGVTIEQWRALVREHGGRCAYCGSAAPLELDHVDPISTGGEHDITNSLPACGSCNASKSNKPLVVWLAWQHRRAA